MRDQVDRGRSIVENFAQPARLDSQDPAASRGSATEIFQNNRGGSSSGLYLIIGTGRLRAVLPGALPAFRLEGLDGVTGFLHGAGHEPAKDMYIGTLSKFIEAMGGELEIRAIFPDGSVRITQFSRDQ